MARRSRSQLLRSRRRLEPERADPVSAGKKGDIFDAERTEFLVGIDFAFLDRTRCSPWAHRGHQCAFTGRANHSSPFAKIASTTPPVIGIFNANSLVCSAFALTIREAVAVMN